MTPLALLLFAVLPGTTLWDFPRDIVAEQYAEMRGWYEQQIANASRQRLPFLNAERNVNEPCASVCTFCSAVQAPEP